MAKVDVNALKDLSAGLGSAVVDPDLWPLFLDRICEAMKCNGAALLPRKGGSFPTSTSMIEPFARYMQEGWYQSDLRLRGIAKQLRGVVVVDDDDVSTEEERRRSPYHNDFLPSVGLKWWAGAAFWAGKDDLWCLAMQRSESEGRFSRLEKSLLWDLSARMTEIASLAGAMGRANIAAFTNALDHVRQAAVAVDSGGHVVHFNAAANDLFDKSVWVSRGQLVLEDKQAASELLDQLEKLRKLPNGKALRASPIVVRRPDKCSMTLKVLPIDGEARSLFAAARAIILLSEVARPRSPRWQLLQQTFLLTRAQAHLAARLATGESLEDSADALGIAKETARTQLKSIFEKTETHRQSELVALLQALTRKD
ncbi:DNA-binding CsgD family transcriptional regulator/PAS domain-containing protein [Sinorhizobium fredii]|uniref:helix-turn-helix transcriptional regulator n=1 Tax=Rhizobium fredii TaxID=380 RepID=UPI00056ABD6B|nr:helix-turn-helix transcriptional regulator [Sinorhizobium fredii]